MSPTEPRLPAADGPEEERELARQGAMAALTAVGRLRGEALAEAGAREPAASAASQSGFAAPARAVRRPVRGTWRSRV